MDGGATSKHWDHVAEQWITRPRQQLWRRHSDAVYRDLFSDWLPASAHDVLKTDLFDEAVGTGLIPWLASRCHRIAAIDLSATVVDEVQLRYPHLDLLHADVRSLPFAADSFDVVLSNSTLDHFASTSEIDRALAEIHRVLRPNGELLITLDNLANPVVRLRNRLPARWLQRIGVLPYDVGVTLDPPGLAQALSRSGFVVQQQRAAFHCPRLPAVLLGSLLDRFGTAPARARYLATLRRLEMLERLSWKYRTGYYVAMRATKPAARLAA